MTEGLHRLWTALVGPFRDPSSRFFWLALLVFAAFAVVWTFVKQPDLRRKPVEMVKAALGIKDWSHPSSRSDLQIFLVRQLLAAAGLIPSLASAYWVSTHLTLWLDRSVGTPPPPSISQVVLGGLYALLLFLAWDLSRFLVHFAMHRVPFLWRFHQVHHSAEVLTPLTFYRLHPVESLIYEVRRALVTGTVAGLAYWWTRNSELSFTLFGLHGANVVLNVVFGNLRHSHLWVRFPSWLERWVISPAQHHLHHSIEDEHLDCNYGTWLAVWDRLLGSLRTAPQQPPSGFGVSAHERNHDPHDVVSLLIGPLKGTQIS